jgi:uncharacterized protein (TIGR00255 family)
LSEKQLLAMLQSMTGFGKADYEDDQLRIQVEVKSVNSKCADINLQVPRLFTAYLQDWKNLLTSHLQRGKIDLSLQIGYKQQLMSPAAIINEPLFLAYYATFIKLAEAVDAPARGLFRLALKSPGVMTPDKEKVNLEVDEATKQKVEETLQKALLACQAARTNEGALLTKSLIDYLQVINTSLEAIEVLDKGRLNYFKARLLDKLAAVDDLKGLVDQDRLEQELVYHLDKIDITEEKVRLATHLAYFVEVMNHETIAGKKLVFIAQEISRELNTLGVKANQATIQQYVIVMKNELEKIKEQLQNIL